MTADFNKQATLNQLSAELIDVVNAGCGTEDIDMFVDRDETENLVTNRIKQEENNDIYAQIDLINR